MSPTLEAERRRVLDEAQQVIDAARSAGRQMTEAERSTVRSKLDRAQTLLKSISERRDDDELRRALGKALSDEPARAGDIGVFSAKAAAVGLVKQIAESMHGAKSIAPSGQAVSPAGLSVPAPISLDRPTPGLLPVLQSLQTPTPPSVSFLKQTSRTNNAAPVADGATKPTSLMGLVRVDTVLQVVATLSEAVNRFWLSDSDALLTWVQQELTADVDVAIEALVFATLAGTSGVQTATDTDPLVALRKSLTKCQIAGGANPFVVMHPSDWETISLIKDGQQRFIAAESAIETVPGGAVSAPYGPTALLSWGMPVALSVAATAKTAWVLAQDAITLFVDGSVLVDWDNFSKFATNEVVGRAETRVYPAVTKPGSCVKVTLP